MSTKTRISRFALLLIIILSTASCDEIIEYSPYQNIVKSEWKQQNVKNYNKLLPEAQNEFKPFRVGLIADSHTYYDDFEKQIDYLNTRDDLDFIIHLGDVTLSANAREFDWYSDLIGRLKVPVFTLIGNHDCLGNGYDIYNEMFGESNFFFEYQEVKFVFFDNVIWEKKTQDPDFDWFASAIVNDNNYKHVIPFSHIYPWDPQFSYGNELVFNYILEEANIPLSIHGHGHSYELSKRYGSLDYLIVPSCIRHELVILDIQKDTVNIERINY